ncbi:universal stress protein [Nocardia thailandica]
MGEYQRVVVGTDGSEAAQDAVTVAGMVATRLLAPLTVVTTWKESSLRAGHDGDWALETTLQAAARLAAENVTAVDRLELPGAAAPMLLDVAGQQPDTVLVLGARGLGRSKARWTGSTANTVSHHLTSDALFVHKVPKRWTTVGLATDGSPSSLRAVRRGYDLAITLGARPFLVTAAKTEADGAATLLTVQGTADVEDPEYFGTDVLTGVPAAEALCNAAWKYDLLVIGNRGMSGPARLLGSVANKVTHDIDTNLLLVDTA